MQMYFLKKIHAVIINEQARKELECWARVYKDGPFEVEIVSSLPPEGTVCKEANISLEALEEQQGSLWITDCSDIAKILLSTAQGTNRKRAVLAYFHDYSDEENASDYDGTTSHKDFGCCRYAMMHPLELDGEYFELIYRRLKGLPWDILETERCKLRESTVADVRDFYEIYREPSITAYMENLFPTPEEESAYLEDYIDKVYGYYDFGIWTVLDKITGQVIGRIGLSYREGFEAPELGFVIGVPWQGRGLAYEVSAAVLSYGKRVLDFERVQAFVEPGNEASLSLCRKLGLKEMEHLKIDHKEYIRLEIVL